jgi:hypothetical protein
LLWKATETSERNLEMTTEERLEKLERELARANRRNRWLLASVVLAIVGLSLAWTWPKTIAIALAQGAEAAPKVIRANEFILEDVNRKPRAGLAVDKDGANLSLYDENGEPRASLGATKDGAKLSLYDENGKGGVMLGATKDGADLSLYDENRKPRAILSVPKDGARLSLYDENGKARGMLSVNKDGAGLSLYGPDGKTLWSAP